MVTHFKDHWDKLPNNQTSYTLGMLRYGLDFKKIKKHEKKMDGKVPTIFIKVNKDTKKFEKAWVGYTYDFKQLGTKIYFKVEIRKEILPPPSYRNLSEGWYFEESENMLFDKCKLIPPIFYLIKYTNNWNEFEEYSFYLLKLLGINEIIRFHGQRGQPDGFFILGTLAVIYDATLEKDFERKKKQQIENFCNMLKSGKINIDEREYHISAHKKQVWIITRGISRKIKELDEIVVKEISVDDLLEVYFERLVNNLREDEIEERLRTLGLK